MPVMVFQSFFVVFLECIYLILSWQSIALPFPKSVQIWLKTVQTSTIYDMFKQVVPVMNCSLAKDAYPQIKPTSSHEHFLLCPLVLLLGGNIKKLLHYCDVLVYTLSRLGFESDCVYYRIYWPAPWTMSARI